MDESGFLLPSKGIKCDKPATVQHGGRWYCLDHEPASVLQGVYPALAAKEKT